MRHAHATNFEDVTKAGGRDERRHALPAVRGPRSSPRSCRGRPRSARSPVAPEQASRRLPRRRGRNAVAWRGLSVGESVPSGCWRMTSVNVPPTSAPTLVVALDRVLLAGDDQVRSSDQRDDLASVRALRLPRRRPSCPWRSTTIRSVTWSTCCMLWLIEEHGDAALGEGANEREHLQRLPDAERRGGLVEHHDVASPRDRPSDRDHLPLTAGERSDRGASGRRAARASPASRVCRGTSATCSAIRACHRRVRVARARG